MKWTDEDIDKLFQDSATKQSFAYRPEYWDAFNASLSNDTPLSQASDSAMDAAFQAEASKIAVDYKPEYWKEFSQSLPIMVPTESIADAGLDAMYREEASQLSFEYKPTYWEEMASLLRRRRRRPDFIWFGLSGVFAVALIALLFFDQAPIRATLQPNLMSDLIDSSDLDGRNQSSASSEVLNDRHNISVVGSNANSAAVPENLSVNSSNATNGNGAINASSTTPPNAKNGNEQGALANNNTSNTQRPELSTAATNEDELSLIEHLETRQLDPIGQDETPSLATVSEEAPRLRQAKQNILPSMYIQALGGISQSAITPSEFHSTSFGIGIGFQAQKNNWTFSSGASVLVENFNDLHLTRSAKVYGFGSDLFQFDLFYKRLYTAELDFHLGYNLGRHRFQFGVRPSFVFSSLVDVSETSFSSSQGQSITSSEERTGVYGFMEGIQQFGLKPSIGYAYNFPLNWTLGINVGTELLPSINEDFISGNNNRLPLDGQLYLRKTINFRK